MPSLAPGIALLSLVLGGCAAKGLDGEPADTATTPVTDSPSDTGTTDSAADADADGYPADEDCDDADPTAHPGADELCDGIDNDCDLEVDEGTAGTFHRDLDADGYGDGAGDVRCVGEEGYVDNTGDCDDTNPGVNPGAAEICATGVDEDCDGEVDESDGTNGWEWYADGDADGYGDVDAVVRACTAPEGFTSDHADCDDTDAAVSPEGEEVCDGVDDDCDGAIDNLDLDGDGASICDDCDDTDGAVAPGVTEACNGIDDDCDTLVDESGATGEATWYADADADGYGDATASIAACEAPMGYIADATDCDDGAPAINPAIVEWCDGIDDDCDGDVDEPSAVGAEVWYADDDGDGFGDATDLEVACDQPAGRVGIADDCDDTDAAVNPDAPELCDGLDEDCDGLEDDDDALDVLEWYADADGDAFGDASNSITACDEPLGYVAGDGDCDDSDPAVNPDAEDVCDGVDDDCDGATDEPEAEVCDGVDNDCDGEVDEADSLDATMWYADADGDAFGDASGALTACDEPSGYVTDDGDCDDTDAAVNPDAEEVCDGVDDNCDGTTDDPADEVCDGVDNDCDGEVDEADSSDATTWYADADGDAFGDVSDSLTACDAPSGYVTDDDDCDDTDAAVNPDAEEVCDGVDDDCDGEVDAYASETYDVYDAFSATANPNGVWTFGSSTTPSAGTLTAYSNYSSAMGGLALPGWYGSAGTEPNVVVNDTASIYFFIRFSYFPYTITLHPGASHEYSVLRWTAPHDGRCTVSAEFLTLNWGDVAVALYQSGSYVDGGILPTRGLTQSISESVGVSAGDTLDFSVGDDGSYYNDTTELTGTITCDFVPPDASTWYVDGDGDTFGEESEYVLSCDEPAGYAADDTDCDDADATVSPDATEVCGDGIDQNCDGADTECLEGDGL